MRERLSLEEYRVLAMETASYEPIDGLSFLYPAIGLIGEAGEVSDKIKKLWRDSGGQLDHSSRYGLVMEIGDTFWFVCALEKEFGVKVSAWVDLEGEVESEIVHVLRINELCGKISGLITRLYHADPAQRQALAYELRSDATKHLGTIYYNLCCLAKFIEVDPEEIMAANIQKLKYRKRTGKIAGSGDYR